MHTFENLNLQTISCFTVGELLKYITGFENIKDTKTQNKKLTTKNWCDSIYKKKKKHLKRHVF